MYDDRLIARQRQPIQKQGLYRRVAAHPSEYKTSKGFINDSISH
jgi:hypothetical protein